VSCSKANERTDDARKAFRNGPCEDVIGASALSVVRKVAKNCGTCVFGLVGVASLRGEDERAGLGTESFGVAKKRTTSSCMRVCKYECEGIAALKVEAL